MKDYKCLSWGLQLPLLFLSLAVECKYSFNFILKVAFQEAPSHPSGLTCQINSSGYPWSSAVKWHCNSGQVSLSCLSLSCLSFSENNVANYISLLGLLGRWHKINGKEQHNLLCNSWSIFAEWTHRHMDEWYSS